MQDSFLNHTKPDKLSTEIKLRFTKTDFTRYASGIWRIKHPPRTDNQKIHGATFPKELIIPLIQMYCYEPYDTVLDVFCGTGTTIAASKDVARHCIGFELNPEFYRMAKQIIDQQSFDTFIGGNRPKLQYSLYNTDCRNLLQYVHPNSVQLMVSSPPYADFIQRSLKDREHRTDDKIKGSSIAQYSTDPLDFGNLSYSDYLEAMEQLMEKLYIVTKPNGYNIWIVKDYRMPENDQPYVPFHSDLATMGQNAGFLWHDCIIWDQSYERKNLFRGSESCFYTNLNYSYIIVLRKRGE